MRHQSFIFISIFWGLYFDLAFAKTAQVSPSSSARGVEFVWPIGSSNPEIRYYGNPELETRYSLEEYNLCMVQAFSPHILVISSVVNEHLNSHGSYPTEEQLLVATEELLGKIQRNELPEGDIRYQFFPKPSDLDVDCNRLRLRAFEAAGWDKLENKLERGTK